jgi:hypothetical protein
MRIYGNKPKRGKTYEAHTEPIKYGMGDYYGRAMKAPIGKMRDGSVGMMPVSKKSLKTSPTSVV